MRCHDYTMACPKLQQQIVQHITQKSYSIYISSTETCSTAGDVNPFEAALAQQAAAAAPTTHGQPQPVPMQSEPQQSVSGTAPQAVLIVPAPVQMAQPAELIVLRPAPVPVPMALAPVAQVPAQLDIAPLDAAIAGQEANGGFKFLDDTGHHGQSRQIRRHFSPVPRYHPIAIVQHGSHQYRGKNALLFHTVRQFRHALVHPHLERVVREVADFGGGEVGRIAALGVVPFLLRGKHTIYRGQKSGCALCAQSPTPPLSDYDRLLPPAPLVHAGKCSYPPC